MKLRKIILAFMAATMFVSCSSDDMTGQAVVSDEVILENEMQKIITFASANTSVMVSRAATGYVEWDEQTDPTTMGVFGWYNLSSSSNESSSNKIFYNVQNTYGTVAGTAWAGVQGNTDATNKWTYTPPQYWAQYAQYNDFDFFGYMPYKDGATVTSEGVNKYTLTVPVTMESAPVTTDEKSTMMLCEIPKHLSQAAYDNGTEHDIAYKDVIPLSFERTFTGMQLMFRLGTTMSEVRQFKIKEVKINCTGMATSKKVTRTYTKSGDTWTADDVVWASNPEDVAVLSTAEPVNIPNLDENDAPATVTLTNANKSSVWGDKYYFIPVDCESVNPTIIVKYDVEVDDGVRGVHVTRQDVVSQIQLKKSNFPFYTSEYIKAGVFNTVEINIVPDYLYVLSEYDHLLGVLVVDTTP